MRHGSEHGFTLIELLIVVALIGILAAIASASVIRARLTANEASAIGSTRSVISAQVAYGDLNRGYADDLASLVIPCPGSTTAFMSADLGANGVTKSGYTFTAAPGAGAVPGPNDCNGIGTQSAYYVMAEPSNLGTSGNRAFASNTASAIWQNTAGTAPTEPFTAGGTVTPLAQ